MDEQHTTKRTYFKREAPSLITAIGLCLSFTVALAGTAASWGHTDAHNDGRFALIEFRQNGQSDSIKKERDDITAQATQNAAANAKLDILLAQVSKLDNKLDLVILGKTQDEQRSDRR